jgi:hypothetical protein
MVMMTQMPNEGRARRAYLHNQCLDAREASEETGSILDSLRTSKCRCKPVLEGNVRAAAPPLPRLQVRRTCYLELVETDYHVELFVGAAHLDPNAH